MSVVDDFEGSYGFAFDPFQRRACEALADGSSVLVAAPTGAGKTVVGEFAAWLAESKGGKTFYTTPIKALSNQKYGDFLGVYGPDRVGLLTGDNSINGDAALVVMTTEVLRNMIYEDSDALAGLRYVVLDEVHYLQDPYRGAVWEEVLIHLPVDVRTASLSATVSNAEEFADWLQTLRGSTEVIIEEKRPVDIRHWYFVADELMPMFVRRPEGDVLPNPRAREFERRRQHGRGRPGRGGHRPRARRARIPRRTEVIDRLDGEGMLPRDELEVLGYSEWLAGLSQGIAAHHAGMIPPFKETVEELFKRNLIKVVFATETLALGINMPARTVAIESLTKFTGERHELMTPGEYTQLSGRAGRRGIDELGHSVVLYQRFTPFDTITRLASTRTYPLNSSFRPSYNMAVNLVRNYDRHDAEHLVNSSFAQFQADRDVVQLERTRERSEAYLASYRERMHCDLGEFDEYRDLVDRLRKAEERLGVDLGSSISEAISTLRPGDVIEIQGGRRRGRYAVVDVARDGSENSPRVLAVSDQRNLMRLTPSDFRRAPAPIGRIRISFAENPRNARTRRHIARLLANPDPLKASRPAPKDSKEVRALRRSIDSHPCHSCPDRGRHLHFADRARRLEREVAGLERRINRRTGTLARRFELVLEILDDLGYVKGWELTDRGETLTAIYNESDLLVVEALTHGLFDELDAPELAAVCSTLVFETRGPEPPPVTTMPTATSRIAWKEVMTLWEKIKDDEEVRGLDLTREPDPGFAERAYRWAAGSPLEHVIGEDDPPGDFFRNVKQLIDLLRQIEEVAGSDLVSQRAGEAVEGLNRGVVAYSSLDF